MLSLEEILVKEHFKQVKIQTEIGLNNEQKFQLNKGMNHLKNLVSDKLGCTDLIEHDIKLTIQETFRRRPFYYRHTS